MKGKFLELVTNALDYCAEQGYDKYAIEDMWEEFSEGFDMFRNKEATAESVETFFKEDLNYQICFLR